MADWDPDEDYDVDDPIWGDDSLSDDGECLYGDDHGSTGSEND